MPRYLTPALQVTCNSCDYDNDDQNGAYSHYGVKMVLMTKRVIICRILRKPDNWHPQKATSNSFDDDDDDDTISFIQKRNIDKTIVI